MIEVIDRNPTHPGRVKMTPVAGQENTYDMVRADAPVETGTPLNRALFESIRKDLTTLQTSVSDIINDHAYKTTIGNIVVGAEFVLYEGGIRVPFIKLSGEYGGTARSLVVRKSCYKLDTLAAAGQGNKYENCKTDLWLNDETGGYLAQLDSNLRAAITEVPVETNVGGQYQSVSTIQRKAFLLSRNEYNLPQSQSNLNEGDVIAYFNSDARRLAQYNGVVEEHWTRTPVYGEGVTSICVNTGGDDIVSVAYSFMAGIRPAFTLPADFEIDLGSPNTGNTVATAEVI